ncbi:MAG: hypothetical protein KDA96_21760 [Planctomycetaceae bacterium]|nr:hypothetical protein [Planctomycetaceae bacterium]
MNHSRMIHGKPMDILANQGGRTVDSGHPLIAAWGSNAQEFWKSVWRGFPEQISRTDLFER